MQRTKIPWATHTWNPIRGCSEVSEGCVNCYAARMASRFNGRGMPFEGLAAGGKWTGKIIETGDEFRSPKKPSRIFVCSVSDLLHPNVGYVPSYKVFSAAIANPDHTFCILTKRPQYIKNRLDILGYGFIRQPENVWLGVTVENQARADERIPLLLETPAAVKFVSVEPMLGPVDLGDYIDGIDWVICGSESGPGARPFSYDWAAKLCDQCLKSKTPFFFKQGPPRTALGPARGRMVEMPYLFGRKWAEIPGDK